MKIIGYADKNSGRVGDNRYVVEMTEGEIAIAAGFPTYWCVAWRENRRPIANGGDGPLKIGAKLEIEQAYSFHARIGEHEAKAKEAATTLRALANLLDGAMPSVVIPPTSDIAPEGSEQ